MKKLMLCLLLSCFGFQGMLFSQDRKQVEEQLKAKYFVVIYFNDVTGDYFGVAQNDKYGTKYGACDLTGKEVVPCAYKYPVIKYPDGNGKFVYTNAEGNYVAIEDLPSQSKSDATSSVGNDATSNSATSQDHKQMEQQLKARYSGASYVDVSGGFFVIMQNGKYGACDLAGNEVVPCAYESVVFKTPDGKYYYQNTAGNYVAIGDSPSQPQNNTGNKVLKSALMGILSGLATAFDNSNHRIQTHGGASSGADNYSSPSSAITSTSHDGQTSLRNTIAQQENLLESARQRLANKIARGGATPAEIRDDQSVIQQYETSIAHMKALLK